MSGPVYQQPGSVKQFQRAGSAGQSSVGRESGFQSSGSLASLPGPAWPQSGPGSLHGTPVSALSIHGGTVLVLSS